MNTRLKISFENLSDFQNGTPVPFHDPEYGPGHALIFNIEGLDNVSFTKDGRKCALKERGAAKTRFRISPDYLSEFQEGTAVPFHGADTESWSGGTTFLLIDSAALSEVEFALDGEKATVQLRADVDILPLL